MIKFFAQSANGRKLLGLVITEENIVHLKNNNPIFINAEQMDVERFDTNDIIIIYFQTIEEAKEYFTKKYGTENIRIEKPLVM